MQVDLLVDRETLSIHENNHKKIINSKPQIHSQNLRSDNLYNEKGELIMELATRFELATPSLGSLYSTNELCPHINFCKILKKKTLVNIFQ